MIIYLDTETTALYPGNICQLSYIMHDKKGLDAKNFFFTVESVDIGAYNVHGFSVERLKELSGGKLFKDYADEIYADLCKSSAIVAHNAKFDMNFLNSEFDAINKPLPDLNVFCSMKNSVNICKLPKTRGQGYKYPKLSELCAHFELDDIFIQYCTQIMFGENATFHDARFDSIAMMLAVAKANERYEDMKILKQYV